MNPIWKGHHLLILENGTKIKLSYYGAFFSVKSIPGIYYLPESSRDKYDISINKLFEDVILP
jgi:hypothetical protein